MVKTTPGGLVQEDPPPRTPYNWAQIAKDLQNAPMKWHKVFDHDRHTLTVSIRNGDTSALRPEAGFEYRTSKTKWVEEDGKNRRYCSLYLRYNPEKDQTRSNGRRRK